MDLEQEATQPLDTEDKIPEERPHLDPEIAKRLWSSRYKEELKNYAFKNKFLNEFHDPEDLFQDMSINVWMKAVNTFDAKAITFTNNVDRSFNAYFHQILFRYLTNLKTHKETGKQEYLRKKRSLDAPLKGRDEEGQKRTLLDKLPAFIDSDPETVGDFNRLLNSLPPKLSEILTYLVENMHPGNTGEVLKEIRSNWGLTTTRLFNALMDEPAFVEFVSGA